MSKTINSLKLIEEYINLTPHPINKFLREDVEEVIVNGRVRLVVLEGSNPSKIIDSSGAYNVTEVVKDLGDFAGMPVSQMQVKPGEETLPEPKDSVGIIVSFKCVKAHPERHDLFTVKGVVYNKPEGKPIGCLGLITA